MVVWINCFRFPLGWKCNFALIINNSSASSKDIYELITAIQQKILQNKGIYLQPEVRMIGFDYPN